jgi:hypothetical protein
MGHIDQRRHLIASAAAELVPTTHAPTHQARELRQGIRPLKAVRMAQALLQARRGEHCAAGAGRNRPSAASE